MSFILEALKKSEEERRRQNIPDVQTIHSPVPPPNRGSRTLKWILLAALVLNAALMIWWIRPWESSQEPAGDDPVVVSSEPLQSLDPRVDAPSPTHEADSRLEVQTVHYERPITPDVKSEPPPRQAEAVPAVDSKMKDPLQKTGPPSVLRIEDLPEDLRRELPEDLRISLHFYTPEAALRMARINGKNLREGQEVIPGCRLEEITPAGVILDYRQIRFSLGDY